MTCGLVASHLSRLLSCTCPPDVRPRNGEIGVLTRREGKRTDVASSSRFFVKFIRRALMLTYCIHCRSHWALMESGHTAA